ncbi:MAG TPA: hypothetical protein VH415_11690 [Nitrososphaeraceae archaeon]|jgi:hypothetical protein
MSEEKAAQDTSEAYQQSLNMLLESMRENQKKLIEQTTEFYSAYFSITSEIIRRSFDFYSAWMSNLRTYPPTFFSFRVPFWPGETSG